MDTATLPVSAARIAQVRRLCRSGEAAEIRAAAGLSLREVGSDAGVSLSSIWRWERGDRLPRGPEAIAYGRVLDELMVVLGRRRGGRPDG